MARASSPLPSASMVTLSPTPWDLAQAAITKWSLTATQKMRSAPLAKMSSDRTTNPGRWRSEQVGLNAAGTPKSTTLPLPSRSPVLTVSAPCSVTIFSSTSGIRSPTFTVIYHCSLGLPSSKGLIEPAAGTNEVSTPVPSQRTWTMAPWTAVTTPVRAGAPTFSDSTSTRAPTLTMVAPPRSELRYGSYRFGRLAPSSSAPARGERESTVVQNQTVAVRQVLSGELAAPAAFLGDQDEWALVVHGEAWLEVGGAVHQMGPGDWAWLPAGTPHRLLRAKPGTSWVTVHARASPTSGTPRQQP